MNKKSGASAAVATAPVNGSKRKPYCSTMGCVAPATVDGKCRRHSECPDAPLGDAPFAVAIDAMAVLGKLHQASMDLSYLVDGEVKQILIGGKALPATDQGAFREVDEALNMAIDRMHDAIDGAMIENVVAERMAAGHGRGPGAAVRYTRSWRTAMAARAVGDA